MVIVRPERRDDIDAIRRVNEAAFDGADEADLVDRLRHVSSYIGLVAVLDNQVIGHIAFSPMTLDPAHPGLDVRGLAPMSVSPTHQREGVGSALVREGLAACRRAGTDVVFVLGHPAYYPRFGFVPAADAGLESDYEASREAFMALELRPGALNGVQGLARYHAAFGSVS